MLRHLQDEGQSAQNVIKYASDSEQCSTWYLRNQSAFSTQFLVMIKQAISSDNERHDSVTVTSF